MANRFLLISSNSSGRGGGERYLVYLTLGLRKIGFDVHVLLSNRAYMDTWETELCGAGAVVRREPLIGLRDRPLRFLQSAADFSQQQRISDICREICPTAILVNQQYDEDGLDYIAGALKAGVAPVAGTLHMPMTAHKHRRPLGAMRGWFLQRWHNRHPYQVIVVSTGSQLELEGYYHLPKKSKIIRYGYPRAETVSEIPWPPSSWNSSLPTVGFCGQFNAQKNLALLVDAWIELSRRGWACQLLMVGDGPERKKVEDKLIASSLQGWHITGWQENPERFLRFIDLYAMSSHFEGLPLALIEAVGQGIPSVTTPFNGACDVAERASWARVAIDWELSSFTNALEETIADLPKAKARAELGKAQFCEYFSVERMARETAEALSNPSVQIEALVKRPD